MATKVNKKTENSAYVSRVNSIVVAPRGATISDMMATKVAIDNTIGYEFVIVTQEKDSVTHCVSMDPEEWPYIKDAIEKILASIEEAK